MILEQIINKHLPADFFARLQGCSIAITCVDLDKNWYCIFDDRLHIVDSEPDHIDVTISSTITGFIQYALHQDRSAMQIAGSITMAETLQQLLGQLDIDWEEELSKYTGDIIAHQTVRTLRRLREIDLDQMLAEYLQEEALLLPTKIETQEFLQAVDELRTEVDRLEARIEAYADHR